MFEVLHRVLYGLSLGTHNFISGLNIGIAVVLFVLAIVLPKGSEKNQILKKCLDALVLCIAVSAISGMLFEIEFRRFWPELLVALKDFNSNPGHKLAVFGYLLSVPLFYVVYHYRLWTYPVVFPVLSFFLVPFVWSFGGWGIFLNTIMQFPLDARMDESGILHLGGSLYDRFFSDYHLYRQLHITASSTLKAIILLAIIFMTVGFGKNSYFKPVWTLGIVAVLVLGFTGHRQVFNIAKHQPAKFSSMENIQAEEDKTAWRPIGFLSPAGKESAWRIEGGLLKMVSHDIIPLEQIDADKRPNGFGVYNSFRIMLYCSFLLLVALVFWRFKRGGVSLKSLWVLLVIAEIAINAGWLLSELGRQPWMFYGVMERQPGQVIEQMNYSVVLLAANIILLAFMSYFCFRILVLNTSQNTQPDERMER